MTVDLENLVKAKNMWREATRGMTAEERKDFAEWIDSLKEDSN